MIFINSCFQFYTLFQEDLNVRQKKQETYTEAFQKLFVGRIYISLYPNVKYESFLANTNCINKK